MGVLGTALILAGLLLVPLPGPGWAIVFAGLALLAVEFAWARRLLRRARRLVSLGTHWFGRRHWALRYGSGALLAALLAAGVAVGVWML
ncbi:hypothetical protein Val02_45520 [Virgisporangium aliadipatigenens]|uniref:TIGR02611 family protein n=1 Tax=Virgisporangium aliadipatigenens TaxID=741659 RepID=A0A8J4DS08_9ACTN|nr:hypothetical protein Val02_45520 [Virgisporangium aliadipatigenens]